jgi:hypothetical protein
MVIAFLMCIKSEPLQHDTKAYEIVSSGIARLQDVLTLVRNVWHFETKPRNAGQVIRAASDPDLYLTSIPGRDVESSPSCFMPWASRLKSSSSWCHACISARIAARHRPIAGGQHCSGKRGSPGVLTKVSGFIISCGEDAGCQGITEEL